MLLIGILNIDKFREGRPAITGKRPLGVFKMRPRGAVGEASASRARSITKHAAGKS